MNCRDVDKLCTQYVDSELDDARANALRGHLRTCPDCLARVEDEAMLRDAAAGLEPMDPPPALWQGIERELAAAEIADAHKPRVWFWWQGLRERALPIMVAVTAAAVLLVWGLKQSAQHQGGEAAEPPPAVVATAAELPPAKGATAGAAEEVTFLEQRADEIARADQRYLATIDELRAMVDEERASWPTEVSAAFDTKLAGLDAAARRHRRELVLAQAFEPNSRDALYTVYRAQVAFLQKSVLGELP